MNKENLELLQENLKYLGFGENTLLNEELELTIAQEPREFQLFTEAFYQENSKLEAALHFRRSDKSGWYFFNHYEALLRIDGEPERDRQQIFYINKGSGITMKEAYNLLQGRSVYKKKLVDREGNEYDAWVQLNFQEKNEHNNNYVVQQFAAGYGYDLEKVLGRYPIRELKFSDQRASLVRSLQRGNLNLVNFEKTRGIEKMYIAANPQYKTIYLYSKPLPAMQRIGKRREFPGMEDHDLPAPEFDREDVGQGESLASDKGTSLKEAAATEEIAKPDKQTGPDTDTGSEECMEGDDQAEQDEDEGPEEKMTANERPRPGGRPGSAGRGPRTPMAKSLPRKGERKLN